MARKSSHQPPSFLRARGAVPLAAGLLCMAAAWPLQAETIGGAYWQDAGQAGRAASTQSAGRAVAGLSQFRALTLDRNSVSAAVAAAPMEFTEAARLAPATVTLPHPDGSFQRFAVVESPVMEAGLAALHPDIKTYSGRGIDDPSASLRMDITPLGLHASVRSAQGAWYVEPPQPTDQSLYASYRGRDRVASSAFSEAVLNAPQISLVNSRLRSSEAIEMHGAGFTPGSMVTVTLRDAQGNDQDARTLAADAEGVVEVSFSGTRAPGDYSVDASVAPTATARTVTARTARGGSAVTVDSAEPVAPLSMPLRVLGAQEPAAASVGSQLRTYRLALLTDPGYANYFGGPANVTAAKVTLINRVTQVYETETSIRMVLIAGNDALNLDTAAQMTGTNGPCGGSACFTASQAGSCTSSTLSRTRVVIGLLVGARNFDVGHIGMGVDGGGLSSLGVVGTTNKAQGCTGIPTPTGDFFAVDYVAHEMGHEYAGNHTFNGTTSSCGGGNRNAGTSVEPGSGSSVMAYAGICGVDNLQPHSDPYWSMKSFDEITTYTSGAETNTSEVQMGVLTGYTTNGQQFVLNYNGQPSAPIVRGTNNTAAGYKAAIEAISGWPSGGTVTVSSISDTAFTVTFGGNLANTQTALLSLSGCTGGCTGTVGEITVGGASTRRGTVTNTGNSAPVVTTTASYTIPVRTPFTLSGSATDADSDALTYMWEQTDRGNAGTVLTNNTKLNGPLFRQFGTAAIVSSADTLLFHSPGENATTTDPTRTFPNMAQILANNTNAVSGACPTASATPTADQIECFSEYLPTAAYVGFAGTNASPASLNFRLTARDGHGGLGSSATQLILAAASGPFLVTSPNTAVSVTGGRALPVSWSVAGTSAAPVSAANVKITLSTDGGASFPYVLAASTANDGSETVTLPDVVTSTARIKIEAVGNVFFDVSDANFTITPYGDANGDGAINCADMSAVRAALGKHTGQAGYSAAADVNGDGVIDVRDLAIVSQHLPSGSLCK